jgi:hypothetical protein
MTYTIHSLAALSRLRQGASHARPSLPEKQDRAAVERSDPFNLGGSATLPGIGGLTPWYVRLFQRLPGRLQFRAPER